MTTLCCSKKASVKSVGQSLKLHLYMSFGRIKVQVRLSHVKKKLRNPAIILKPPTDEVNDIFELSEHICMDPQLQLADSKPKERSSNPGSSLNPQLDNHRVKPSIRFSFINLGNDQISIFSSDQKPC